MPIAIDDYPDQWRQVRLFCQRADPYWYAKAVVEILRPLFEAYPGPLLFGSRYCAPLGLDDGDTDIAQLPAAFLHEFNGNRWHRSIRIRFRTDEGTEAEISERVHQSAHYWFSAFLDYPILDDLGGPRFSPNQDNERRLQRTRLVAELLRANTRLVVDAVVQGDGAPHFEENAHPENQRLRSSFQSVGHMLSNVWVDSSGIDLPVLAIPREALAPALFQDFRL
jgi:hypothetical protein